MGYASGSKRLWQSVRRLPGRTPLRVKLISSVLVLGAVALTIISFAGISFLRSYLLGSADDHLRSLIHAAPFDGLSLGIGPHYLSEGTILWVPDGGTPQLLVRPVSGSGYGPAADQQVLAGPRLPADVSSLPTSASNAITVPATSGDGRWRIVGLPASAQPDRPGGPVTHGTLVLGTDVSSVYSTLDRLAGIDLIVSSLVILGLAIVGVTLVRASLRPLTDIERTAEGIAAGDLARRVPDRDPRTEVGRLGRSLNAMLAHIETAFEARAWSEYAARRSEERMRQFVTDASHELRTPLTTIRGFAEYYRQRGGVADLATAENLPASTRSTPEDPDQTIPASAHRLSHAELDRLIRRVEQEATRMGVLVDDMLLLARLDQQRPLEFRTVDLLAIAADALHDARVVAPKRTINLTVGTPDAPLVLGDEVRLRQVVGNLMSNAMTHTPDGTPIEITIRSGTLGDGLDAIILEVADTGPGLTDDQQEHVFERFYRTDRARTRTAGGTGLGLAIVAALVSAHYGRVWVDSKPGSGATFGFALPLAPEARAA